MVGRRRWLIEIGRGELRLVEGEGDVDDLVRRGLVTGATPVYAVGPDPQALVEIPELARRLPEPSSSEPPVRRDFRSPERAQLSEELAILNRPLADDVEYYDELPTRRWPKRFAALVVLAAAAFGGYTLLWPRIGGSRSPISWLWPSSLPPTSPPAAIATPTAAVAPSPSPIANAPKMVQAEPAGTAQDIEGTAVPAAPASRHRLHRSGQSRRRKP